MEKRNCLKCETPFDVGVQVRKVYCSLMCQRAAVDKRRSFKPERRAKKSIWTKQSCQQLRATNRQIVFDYKLAHSCPCGESCPACLVFHHRDAKTKKFAISVAINHGVSSEELLEEMKKM